MKCIRDDNHIRTTQTGPPRNWHKPSEARSREKKGLEVVEVGRGVGTERAMRSAVRCSG